jgi:hypothetical protein
MDTNEQDVLIKRPPYFTQTRTSIPVECPTLESHSIVSVSDLLQLTLEVITSRHCQRIFDLMF